MTNTNLTELQLQQIEVDDIHPSHEIWMELYNVQHFLKNMADYEREFPGCTAGFKVQG